MRKWVWYNFGQLQCSETKRIFNITSLHKDVEISPVLVPYFEFYGCLIEQMSEFEQLLLEVNDGNIEKEKT